MPKKPADDEILDDEDEDTDDDAQDADDEDTDDDAQDAGADRPSGAGVPEDVTQLLAALKDHGIHLREEDVTSPQSLVRALLTALHALKGMLQPAGGDVQEEPPMTSTLSLENAVRPYREKLAISELRSKCQAIDALVSNGQVPPHVAKEWKGTIADHKLSLADDTPNGAVTTVLAQMEYARKNVPPGTLWDDKKRAKNLSLSGVVEVPPVGDASWSDPASALETQKQVAKEFCDKHGIPWKED